MKMVWLTVIVLALVIALAFWGDSSRHLLPQLETREISLVAIAGTEPAVPLKKRLVEKPEPVSLLYAAVLEPKLRTLLSTEVNSKVVKVYKKMGDSFKEGELLIQLDDVSQKAIYERALATLDKANVTAKAKATLYHDGIASYSDYIEAVAAVAVAESDVVVAAQNLGNTQVLAPYDGRVVLVNVADGEYPNRQLYYKDKPLIEIVNDRVMLAKVLVPANLLKDIRVGQMLFVHVNETEQTVGGKITRIGAMIDPVSSTVPIEAEIDNTDGALIGGMTGMADLQTLSQEGVP